MMGNDAWIHSPPQNPRIVYVCFSVVVVRTECLVIPRQFSYSGKNAIATCLYWFSLCTAHQKKNGRLKDDIICICDEYSLSYVSIDYMILTFAPSSIVCYSLVFFFFQHIFFLFRTRSKLNSLTWKKSMMKSIKSYQNDSWFGIVIAFILQSVFDDV